MLIYISSLEAQYKLQGAILKDHYLPLKLSRSLCNTLTRLTSHSIEKKLKNLILLLNH